MCQVVNTMKQHNDEVITIYRATSSDPPVIFIPRSTRRTALWISCPSGSAVRIGPNVDTSALNNVGILLPNLGQSIVLSKSEHGALVQGPFYVAGTGGVAFAIDSQTTGPENGS